MSLPFPLLYQRNPLSPRLAHTNAASARYTVVLRSYVSPLSSYQSRLVLGSFIFRTGPLQNGCKRSSYLTQSAQPTLSSHQRRFRSLHSSTTDCSRSSVACGRRIKTKRGSDKASWQKIDTEPMLNAQNTEPCSDAQL